MRWSNRIRIIIADDHAMIRHGLTLTLNSFDDLLVVATAENGEEALRLAVELEPDIILMDLHMPVMDGVAATKAIRQQVPQATVIALTSISQSDQLDAALAAGAESFLLKNISLDILTDTIRSVRREATPSPSKQPTTANNEVSP